MPKEFNWIPLSTTLNKRAVSFISKKFRINRIASEILLRRGLTSEDNIRKYLYGTYNDLYNPFIFKDMLKAVARVLQAVDKRERVMVHGDYDVDGITSTAMITMMFENMSHTNIRPFCPPRSLGYGLSVKAVQLAIRDRAKLLITCDCGSNEHKPLSLAKKNGIDVIILDHHSFTKRPKVLAFINPNDGNYPFDSLCGAGVAFKLLQAVNGSRPTYPENYLDLVALATVADSEPLVDENRILVKLGLRRLSHTDNLGLACLLKACGFYQKKITTEIAGFIIAPKINAPGRLKSPKPALDLLLTIDNEKAEKLSSFLIKINKKRIEINNQIRDEAIEMVERDYKDDRFLVLENNNWSKGIIGIVASTMTEIYHKPAAIVSRGYGSVRTVPEYPLLEPLGGCADLFQNWGGHPMAAGLHVKKRKVPAFRNRINSLAEGVLPKNPVPYMKYDSKIKLRDIKLDLIEDIEKLEPFGMGNPTPYFVVEDVRCAKDRITKDGQHMQLSISQKGTLLSAIGFWLAGHKEIIQDPAQKFDLLCMLERSKYDSEQLVVKDLKEVKLDW